MTSDGASDYPRLSWEGFEPGACQRSRKARYLSFIKLVSQADAPSSFVVSEPHVLLRSADVLQRHDVRQNRVTSKDARE
jgi:hypothetical protein